VDESRLINGLLTVAQHLRSDTSLTTRLSALCREVVELSGCDRSTIYLLDGSTYRARYNFGSPPDIVARYADYRFPTDNPLIVAAMNAGECVVVNDARCSPLFDPGLARDARIAALAVAALRDDAQQPLGFLTAEYCEHAGTFSTIAAQLVLGLAKLAELAVVAEQRRRQREAAETALRHSEAYYRLLIEQTSDMITVLSADGTRRYESPSIQRTLGHRPEDVVGTSAFDLVHPDDVPRVFQVFSDAVRAGRATQAVEFRARHADGTWRDLEAIGTNRLADPSFAGIVITTRDITERKRAAAALEDEASIAGALARIGHELISSLDTPVLLDRLCQLTTETVGCDCSHTLLWRRDEDVFVAVSSYGELPEHWEALRLLRIPRHLFAEVLDDFERREHSERLVSRDTDFAASVGRRYGITVGMAVALRRGAEITGFLTACYRGRQEPFSVAQVRIAKGLAQLASLALENARLVEELEQAGRLKSEFMATMSHELRTPLNIIMGYNSLLLEGAFGPVTPEQAQVSRRVQASADELLELVSATLDYSRLQAGRMSVDPQDVDMHAVLATIKAETAPLHEQSGLDFEWQIADLPRLYTDPLKLKVVLKNLIGNAVKFTERGRVTIAARAHEGGVAIRVSDTGIGIAPDLLAAIFEPFRQVQGQTTRVYSGVGLGLYIARQLIDLLGGRISVDSTPNVGSTFTIWLPRRLPPR